MVTIRWCLQQKDGLSLVDPNGTISESYIGMAEESAGILKRVESSKIWTATATYYIFYYSLYSLMLRIGVKCGIHSCSIEFMRQCLSVFYNNKDFDMIEKAFKARIDLQYYSDRPVDDRIIEETRKYCILFFIKTKDILSQITEKQINEIREGLKG